MTRLLNPWHGRPAHVWHGHLAHASRGRPAPASAVSRRRDAGETHGRDAHATPRDAHVRASRHLLLRFAACLALLAAMLSGGCVTQTQYQEARDELSSAQQKVAELQAANERLMSQIRRQDEQIISLMALGPKRLDDLFHVKSVSIGRNTSGVNTKSGSTDDKSGNDAVRVYITPLDQDGSVIKAAGTVKIQLYDLAAPPNENLVGDCNYPLDEVRKQWASGFLSYLPLEERLPQAPHDHRPHRVHRLPHRRRLHRPAPGRRGTADGGIRPGADRPGANHPGSARPSADRTCGATADNLRAKLAAVGLAAVGTTASGEALLAPGESPEGATPGGVGTSLGKPETLCRNKSLSRTR